MNEQLAFYQKQAMSLKSPVSWLADIQANALADFERVGFPKRRDEAWKYTSVEAFLKQDFKVELPADTSGQSAQNTVPCDHQLTIVNGVVSGVEDIASALPNGMIVMPLLQAITEHEDKIRPHLTQILPHEHGFQALNTAMMHSGVFIYVPSGVKFSPLIKLSHWQNQSEQAVFLRHLIVAEADSEVNVIEDYQGLEDKSYFTNVMVEIYAAKDAVVRHYKVQQESHYAYHIAHLAVSQAAGSQVDSHSLSTGGKLVRSDATFHLNESTSRCLMNGIYAPGEGQHVDHHTLVEHKVPDCHSEQDYKGILAGKSRAVFNGIVRVSQDAQQTVAKQQNKNILLSDNAEVDTKPQLEIYADDVVCTHGATVGQLDEDALFYLATRGIERSEASRYLIQAFAAENLRAIGHQKLSEWMRNHLNQQLG